MLQLSGKIPYEKLHRKEEEGRGHKISDLHERRLKRTEIIFGKQFLKIYYFFLQLSLFLLTLIPLCTIACILLVH